MNLLNSHLGASNVISALEAAGVVAVFLLTFYFLGQVLCLRNRVHKNVRYEVWLDDGKSLFTAHPVLCCPGAVSAGELIVLFLPFLCQLAQCLASRMRA